MYRVNVDGHLTNSGAGLQAGSFAMCFKPDHWYK